MLLQPLVKQTEIELIVSETGNVMLLHRDKVEHDYSWAQYDQLTNGIQLVTECG